MGEYVSRRASRQSTVAKKLPDLIFLDEIAEKLWNRRAVVMVGAGFSKNADDGYPDWRQLSDVLWEKLHGGDNPDPTAKNYADVLQLAEEFASTYGRADLDELIDKACNRPNVTPSVAHTNLLSLPWADVFTTNYDTLLERASYQVPNIKYGLVTVKEDLTIAPKPRIVKLHGSFPSTRPFVLTAKDYRLYPHIQAAFVNTVQQALIENVMCLVGFSGDDPNFLQWVEWIRRNLGGQELQKMYLISLNELSVSRKCLLRSRGLEIVDLCPWKKSKNDFIGALLACFDYLKGKEPLSQSWPILPRELSAGISSRVTLEKIQSYVKALSELRLSEPRRIIQPDSTRETLFFELLRNRDMLLNMRRKLTKELGRELVIDLVWLSKVCLVPLTPVLARGLQEVVSPSVFGADGEKVYGIEVIELQYELLRYFREIGDWKRWESLFRDIQKTIVQSPRGWNDRIAYERCLRLQYECRLGEFICEVRNWRPADDAPEWMVRKAGLLIESGSLKAARELADKALQLLRRRVSSSLSLNADDALMESAAMILIRRLEGMSSESDDGRESRVSERSHIVLCDEDVDGDAEEKQKQQKEEEAQRREEIRRRLAKQQFFYRQYELKKIQCDLTDELKSFSLAIGTALATDRADRAGEWFDIHDKHKVSRFVQCDLDFWRMLAYRRFHEETGLTIRIGHCVFAEPEFLARVAKDSWRIGHAYACSMLVLMGRCDLVGRVYSRDVLRDVGSATADNLIAHFCDALYGLSSKEGEDGVGIARQLLPELLSRLVCKATIVGKRQVALFVQHAYDHSAEFFGAGITDVVRRLVLTLNEDEQRVVLPMLAMVEQPKVSNGWTRCSFPFPLGLVDYKAHPLEFAKAEGGIEKAVWEQLVGLLVRDVDGPWEWSWQALGVLMAMGLLSQQQKDEVCSRFSGRFSRNMCYHVRGEYLYTFGLWGSADLDDQLRKMLIGRNWPIIDPSMSELRSRQRAQQQMRDIREVAVNVVNISLFRPGFFSTDSLNVLADRFIDWNRGNRTWLTGRAPGSPLQFSKVLLVVLDRMMTEVVLPGIRNEQGLIDGLSAISERRKLWPRMSRAIEGMAKDDSGCPARFDGWDSIFDQSDPGHAEALCALHEYLLTNSSLAATCLSRLHSVVRIAKSGDRHSELRLIEHILADERIEKDIRAWQTAVALLETLRRRVDYDTGSDLRYCMEMRSDAVAIAKVVQRCSLDFAQNDALVYWKSVMADPNEFAEVRNGV